MCFSAFLPQEQGGSSCSAVGTPGSSLHLSGMRHGLHVSAILHSGRLMLACPPCCMPERCALRMGMPAASHNKNS